jgi:lipopolysaccharide heptosyltransferase I
MKAMATHPRHPAGRFLIVRLGALGDIVHAIPVAAALRRTFPEAVIDWLVSARHREILDLVTVLDARLPLRDRRGAGKGLGLAEATRQLRNARYDVAVDLQGLVKSAALARASGAPRVLGFSRLYLREPLARAFYTEAHDPGGRGIYAPSETRHVVEINLGLLQPLGVAAGPAEFPIARVPSAVAARMVERTNGAYALLNPGAAWPNKRWPPARLAAVARSLFERHGLMSVVLWGPGERELGEAVQAAAPEAAALSPETAVADIVELARGAAIMVSGDTGPTHIAAAVGTPIVGIYGPTRPERNGPWRPGDVTVSRAALCRCHHLRRCREPKMCLLDVEVAEVVEACERRLAAGRTDA